MTKRGEREAGWVNADVDLWGITKCSVYRAVCDYWTFVWINACLKYDFL
jgi:hypothetical protein